MNVSLLCVLCVVRSLRQVDHSSRGVLPTVVRRCVWSRNLVNEEDLAHWGLSRQKQTNKHACRNAQINSVYTCIWNVFGCDKYLLRVLAKIAFAERSFCYLFKPVHRAVYLSNVCVHRRLCKYCKNLVCLRKENSTMWNRLCCLMHGFDLVQTVFSLRPAMGIWHSKL